MKHRQQSSKSPAVWNTSNLLVQAIHTEWSKAARGGALATARNRVPIACPIPFPLQPPTESSYLIHHLFYSEADAFQHPYYDAVELKPRTERTHYVSKRSRLHAPFILMPHTTILSEVFGKETIRYDRISLTWGAETITVGYTYTDGVPYTTRASFMLELDQWARIQYNARYSVDAGWVYDKWVFNIGFFRSPDPNLFLTTTPTKAHSHMSQLR